MRADDLTVTVRDKTLARVGVIPPHLLEGTFVIPDTAVGDWKLRLPADHAMAALLRTPGYGIIVDGPDGTLFSGPMVKSTRDSDYRDEAGTVTIEGVTDEIILWDALAYPPEGFAYDTFTGEPWEIFDHFLDFNLGDLGRFPLGSFGNLLITDFSAVDGAGGGGNMIPNPDPQGEWTTYFSAPYESAPVAGTGWSCTVDAGSLSSNMLTNWNVPTDGNSSFWADVNVPKANFTIYPVPSGTDAVAVTASTAYDFGCKVAVGYWGTLPSAQIKVDWYDAAGDLLSSSSGSDAALAEYPGAGTWYNMPDDYLLSSAGFCEADPTATLTSPAGAAFARPSVYVHSTSTALDDVYVAQFSMVVG